MNRLTMVKAYTQTLHTLGPRNTVDLENTGGGTLALVHTVWHAAQRTPYVVVVDADATGVMVYGAAAWRDGHDPAVLVSLPRWDDEDEERSALTVAQVVADVAASLTVATPPNGRLTHLHTVLMAATDPTDGQSFVTELTPQGDGYVDTLDVA